jgi:hypothetical protein
MGVTVDVAKADAAIAVLTVHHNAVAVTGQPVGIATGVAPEADVAVGFPLVDAIAGDIRKAQDAITPHRTFGKQKPGGNAFGITASKERFEFH